MGSFGVSRRRLALVGIAAVVVAGGVAVAIESHQPPASSPPFRVEPPVLPTQPGSPNPNNQGGPSSPWDGTGMFCQNQWVICR